MRVKRQSRRSRQIKMELKRLTKTPAYKLLDKYEKDIIQSYISGQKSIGYDYGQLRPNGRKGSAFINEPDVDFWKYDLLYTLNESAAVKQFLELDKLEARKEAAWAMIT